MKNNKTFNCYSRKLMYFLGLHGINYLDKFASIGEQRPYWTFESNERLTEVISKWDDFKKTL